MEKSDKFSFRSWSSKLDKTVSFKTFVYTNIRVYADMLYGIEI